MMKKLLNYFFLLVAMLLGFAISAFATRAQYDAVSHSQPVNVEGNDQVLFNLAYGGIPLEDFLSSRMFDFFV